MKAPQPEPIFIRKALQSIQRAAALSLAALPLAANAQSFPAEAFDPDGFAYATPGVELTFPRDHGSHPQFKTEWWYLTGHLEAEESDEQFGFQVTFFRAASLAENPENPPEQLYMAHAAVFDKQSGAFHHEERLNSDHWNADAAVGELDLFNGNWYLRMDDPTTESMTTRFSLAKLGSLTLQLKPAKPKTLFGDQGYSRKGDSPGAASYYITFPRLDVSGSGTLRGRDVSFAGQAWMDHEFSSSQLSPGQIGWNWTSLILDDGSELMAYVMRREDGAVDPHSRLTLIAPDGSKRELTGDAFSWTPIRHWTSPRSGGRYPVEYRVSWKSGDTQRSIHVKPFGDDQELSGDIGGFVYWEGASQAFDADGQPIGLGYTELTGYHESLYGQF